VITAARALLVLLALSVCALQLPLLATDAMPGMAMAAASTDIEMIQAAHHADAPACCALTASPVSRALLAPLVLATFVVLSLLTWLCRPALAPNPPREQVPLPGSRGRPILHAYLN
jgi:hypothetical protein